ncbi:ABC transporter ATP-binding protein [Isoptericola dokdonensis]|jgi:ABC-2 type transport system ATP-binding protein|uniref:Putative ABC transporter ATP-binding protein YxlF n=1 Tax=Isoptericola dokdonensis DS-3 TaxID=1300344 RepID=A0A161I311_9MICO|nr:ABC transporter ATP-binding protein [Isoptericola dokdonensis]ANC32235.1 putative ABC transporter ATP-binding protein YxlF [Isoptericola dokdonensis DS-3]
MITVEHLTKRYGPVLAVDDVSFTAEPGLVTGFLGPNGAGKSTTMRMMCGLTPASSGSTRILGLPYAALTNPGRRVGVLLDASAQHAGRTGREVLALAALLTGVGRSRVDEVLDVVGLTTAEASRRVGTYSLGMRQRLGLAGALLGEPEVLILDEPANGLDPAGIRWMRDLLRGYAADGGTVLLSSHLLGEIEQVADRIVVIGRGRIVADGTKDELLRGAGTYVRSTDDAALVSALRAAGTEVEHRTGGGVVATADAEHVARTAASAGVVVVELREASSRGLEELFLELTAEHAREEVTA